MRVVSIKCSVSLFSCHRLFADEAPLFFMLPFILLPLHTAGHDGTPKGRDLRHISPNFQPETEFLDHSNTSVDFGDDGV